jgi:hypothetical protein
MSLSRIRFVGPLLLLLIALISGCGGSSTTTQTVTVPVTVPAAVSTTTTPSSPKKMIKNVPTAHRSVPISKIALVNKTPTGAGFSATFPVNAGAMDEVDIMDGGNLKFDPSDNNSYETDPAYNKGYTRACYGGNDDCYYDSSVFSVDVEYGRDSLKPFFCRHGRSTVSHLGHLTAKQYRCKNATEILAFNYGYTYRVAAVNYPTPQLRKQARNFIKSFEFTHAP